MVSVCLFCGSADEDNVGRFDAPPAGEPDFRLAGYSRTVVRCRGCGHLSNRHRMDLSTLYAADYRATSYGVLRERFDRIMALPKDQSDNRQRVKWLADRISATGSGRKVLDVGSGTAVFGACMQENGWSVTAIDPDPQNVQHAIEAAGVSALVGDFRTMDIGGSFDLITFNKVLEHLEDPVAPLDKATALLAPDGAIYVELPDGEEAIRIGPDREEFYVDHYHAFSAASFCLLVAKAGLRLATLERVVEPSGKLTLRGLARKVDRSDA